MGQDELVYNLQLIKQASTSEKLYRRKQEIQISYNYQKTYNYVVSGFVRMYMTTSCGHELTLMIYRPGSLFSLMPFFNPLEHTFHFQAFSDVKLLIINEKDFYNKLFTDYQTLKVLCGRYTLGMNRLSQRLGQAYYSTAKSRVISAICYFIKLCGIRSTEDIKFSIPITHEDIAGIAGLTRENTSRILSKLKKEKIISMKYRYLAIIDINKFKDMACLDKKIINTL